MDSSLVTLLTGSAGAVGVLAVFCCLFILGKIFPQSVVEDKDKEIAELKAALQAEREARQVAVSAAAATTNILSAIQVGRSLEAGHDA